MLPEEREVQAQIQRQFGVELATMTEVHDLAVAAVAPQVTIGQGPDLDPAVHTVGLALYVKACKQARSIEHLCGLGMGTDANSLVRSLFETTLALRFVLKRRVRLQRDGKSMPVVPGKPLNRRLRARLFVANSAFEHERLLDDWLKTRGLKRSAGGKLDARHIREHSKNASDAIGTEWTQRLKKTKSYSGLNLKDLSRSLGFIGTYATLYRLTSWSVHGGADLEQFVIDDGGKTALLLSPSDGAIRPAIGVASVMLLSCALILNEAFGLGLDAKIEPLRLRLGLRTG